MSPGAASVRPSSGVVARDEATPALAKALVDDAEHVTSDQLSALLAGSPSGHHLAQLRRQGALLGLRFAHRGYLYPAFQLDPAMGRVDPTIAKVNRLLLRRLTVHEAIVWWFTAPGGTIQPRRAAVADRPTAVIEDARSAALNR